MHIRTLSQIVLLGLIVESVTVAIASAHTVTPQTVTPQAAPDSQIDHSTIIPVPIQLAQSAGSTCLTQRNAQVYSAANFASKPVGQLQQDTVVTFAGEPNTPVDGWLQISEPLRGYIRTNALTGTASNDPLDMFCIAPFPAAPNNPQTTTPSWRRPR